jgi:hypothetical protein
MGLSRRPSRGQGHDWTLNLTEISASEAAAYQLSKHPALGLFTRPSATAASQARSAR